jgi:hypothetical protein
LTVGAMGHASQIALGIAMEKPERTIWCFDGDGASIMHMGSMAIIGHKAPKNYRHVIFNNGAHDSVGGQPTVGLNINIPSIAKAVGYKESLSVDSKEDLSKILPVVKELEGPVLLEIKVKKGNRKDLGRPTTTPIQNKESLMEFLQKEQNDSVEQRLIKLLRSNKDFIFQSCYPEFQEKSFGEIADIIENNSDARSEEWIDAILSQTIAYLTTVNHE